MNFFDRLYRLIATPDLAEKVQGPSALLREVDGNYLRSQSGGEKRSDKTPKTSRLAQPGHFPYLTPGRPERMKIVTPKETGRPHDVRTVEGRAFLLHALAQIELSALELALDSSMSYSKAPYAYHREMLLLAEDEARHFQMLSKRLSDLGFCLGDFPIHTSLWQQAREAGDILERLVIVPRILEARGLDATPGLITRFQEAGDTATAAILDVIYREEIGHVALGSRWFRCFAHEAGLDPDQRFGEILGQFYKRHGRGRFVPNIEARRQAGFSEKEISLLCS